MPSSTSIPSSPLPFGADTHSHTSWRHSHPRLTHPYQSYASFLAAAQARNAGLHEANTISHITTPSIAPSSVSSLPRSHRRLLRRHRRFLYALLAGFYISSILLTVAIVLIVSNFTLSVNHGLRASGVIMGVMGFAGASACLAGSWSILKARKDRKKMEENWKKEEKEKGKRHKREKAREMDRLRTIKEREQSLSAGRSVSRGRRRDEKDGTRTSTSARRAESEGYLPGPGRRQSKKNAKSTSTKRADLEGYVIERDHEMEILPASFQSPPPQPAISPNRASFPPRATSLDRYVAAERQKPTTGSRDSTPWTHHLDLDTDDDDENPPTAKSSRTSKRKPRHGNRANRPDRSMTPTHPSATPSAKPSISPQTTPSQNPPTHPPSQPQPHQQTTSLIPTHPTRSPPPRPGPRSPNPSPIHQPTDPLDPSTHVLTPSGAEVASEDEEVREARRTRSMERVRRWQDGGGEVGSWGKGRGGEGRWKGRWKRLIGRG